MHEIDIDIVTDNSAKVVNLRCKVALQFNSTIIITVSDHFNRR